jgi:PAS domain S-box-containing protein
MLFEHNPMPMWVYDRETLRFLAVNAAAVAHYGYSRVDFLAMTLKDIRPPEDVPALLKILRKASEGVDRAGVWRHLTKDGRLLRVEITAHALRFADRPAALVLANDVTTRAQAEEELQRTHAELERRVRERAASLWESEARFQAFMDHAPTHVFMKDAKGRFVYANKSFLDYFGRTLTGLLGHDDFSLVERKVAQEFRRFDRQVLRGERCLQRLDTVPRPDGQHDYFMAFKFPWRDARGRRFLGAMAVDITEHMRAEAALRESEERYRRLVEVSPDAILISRDGRYIFANQAAVQIFGAREAADLLGRTAGELFHPDFHPIIADRMRRLRKTMQPAPLIEEKIVRLDGAVRDVEVAATPLSRDGELTTLVVLHDITERRQLEREIVSTIEREQERIGQDLHDGLVQVLAGVKVRAGLLRQKLVARSMPEADDVTTIEALLAGAVDEARTLAHGLHPVRLGALELTAALEELAADSARLFGVTCRWHCSRPIPVGDHAVAHHLFRIAQEAIQNAVKHGHARRIWLALANGDGRLALAIEDNGAGFDPAKPQPTGMGLHNMQTRARLIGGTLDIRRRPRGGMAVTCNLPHR